MRALKDARADSFLVNVIQNLHSRPYTKLQGLLNVANAGHEARGAESDIDQLIIDGNEAPWSVLEDWARGGVKPKATARFTAPYNPDCCACPRGRRHDAAEHEAILRRNYAASRGDHAPRQERETELSMAD